MDRVEYSVMLFDKDKFIKHIGHSKDINEAKKIMKKRKLLPNQKLSIGKYVNGVLEADEKDN